jgi:pyridoxamine 5'-phosphate oxidase
VIQIKQKQNAAPAYIPDFDDPLGLLVHCHKKIEAQLASLERAVPLLRQGDAETVDAALGAIAAARAHFAGPGVKHTADEDESLFPRLRRYAGATEREVLAALDELEAQHRVAEQAHASFDALAEALARGGAELESSLDAVDAGVAGLVRLYGPHILLENDVIFPAAARAIPPDELLAIGREMRARRADMLSGAPRAGR